MTRHAQLLEQECEHVSVDTSGDSTTVFSGPCIYYGSIVTTALSAHTVLVKDGAGDTIDHYAASAAAGTIHAFPFGVKCGSLVVDPDNSSTGNITVFFRRAHTTSP